MIRSRSLFTLPAIFLSLSACKKEPPPPAPPREPWMIVASAMRQAREGSNPERCNPEGKDCKTLGVNERFEGTGLVKTGAGSRVSLKLDEATSLDLLENSAVKLVHEGDGAVTLETGAIAVRHEGEGPRHEYPLRLPGAVVSWTSNRTVTFAVRKLGDGAAVVTVRQGLLKLKFDKYESFDLHSGETVRLSSDKAPDKRAVWMGMESPVEYVENPRPAERLQSSVPRGFGSMTARVPGTSDTIQGVRLASHKVQVVVRDGFARTEIEEEFFNETAQVLEGRYMFPLPADASISRLALWVGNDLVEGEVLERDRAKAIFQQIVDDTVRPRDPALLEWVSGSEFSLKIFPIPAKGSRKVILAYNQVLPAEGGRVRYVYPLSLGEDRSTKINDFSLAVRALATDGSIADIMTPGYAASVSTGDGKATVDYSAKDFVPSDDFVVSFRSGSGGGVRAATYSPKEGEFQTASSKPATAAATTIAKPSDSGSSVQPNYFAVRLEAALPDNAPLPNRTRRDVVIVIDTSHSQSRETLEREVKLASGLLRQMDPDEQFVLVACDSACSTYPEKGFSSSTEASIELAEKWLRTKTPGGSSDIAGALLVAAERLVSVGTGQLIYVGDGSPTSGELSAATISSRVRSKIEPHKVDLRFLGAGRTVDDVTLAGLARTFGGTYERVHTGDQLEKRIVEIGMGLRSPVVRFMTATLPESMKDVYPRQLPNLRLGQEVMLFGRMEGQATGDVVLRGELEGAKYELRRPLNGGVATVSSESEKANPLVPRLWAESRIRELEVSDEKAFVKEAVDLSKRFHVMSRHTAFLVLENERMFAEFGVERTTRKADDQSDQKFATEPEPDPESNTKTPAMPAATATAAPAAPPPPPAPRAPAGRPMDIDEGWSPPKLPRQPERPSFPRKPPPRHGHWVFTKNTSHTLDTSDWNKAGEEELQKLRKATTDAQQSRSKRITLVRGLLQRGRFEDAFTEAQRLAELDPDLPDAHELVAQTAAARGDMQRAMMEMDTQAELRPRRTMSHTLAARVFEAAGDERRACAHWRSAAELDAKSDDVLYEAFRCRARVLDGRDDALRDAKVIEKPGTRLKKIIEALEKGETPSFSSWPGGHLFKASVQCEPQNAASVPHLIIINHLGVVISPWTPTQAPTGPGLAAISFSMPDGIYRTMVWGSDGARCELTVDANGTTKKFPIAGSSVVVKTSIETSRHFNGGWGDYPF